MSNRIAHNVLHILLGQLGAVGMGVGGQHFVILIVTDLHALFHPSLSLNDTLQLMGRAQLGDRLGCFVA